MLQSSAPLPEMVAPFTGAWIEIIIGFHANRIVVVAPFTGAWIEIKRKLPIVEFGYRSLPSRERGLKFEFAPTLWIGCPVAPFTGAWIEIQMRLRPEAVACASLPSRERGLKCADSVWLTSSSACRSLHGSVD